MTKKSLYKLCVITAILSLVPPCLKGANKSQTKPVIEDKSDNGIYHIDNPELVFLKEETEEIQTIEVQENEELNIEIQVTALTEEEKKEIAREEMQTEIDNITPSKKKDKLGWFLEYKKIVEKYSGSIEPQETIYDVYTKRELDFLFSVVHAEVGDYSFDAILNVVSVIFNRIDHEEFGDTIDTVLTRRQFQAVANGRYKRVEVSEETKLAVEYVYLFGDTTDGALFYMNKRWSTKSNIRWFENNLEYIFTDSSNHSFYK